MKNYEPLDRICRKHLGLSLDALSEAEIQQALPALIAAVDAERVEISKSATLVLGSYAAVIPNPGILRDETAPSIQVAEQTDKNACLDSLFPI